MPLDFGPPADPVLLATAQPETAAPQAVANTLLLVAQVLARDPGETKSHLWSFLVNGVAGSHLVPGRVRTILFRVCGMDVSRRALIRPQVIFRTGNVSLGKGTTINYRCLFDNRARVTIGERVGVGIGVTFITSSHSSGDSRQRAGEGFLAPITVGDGAWLGSGCTILPGVTIGTGVVVAAGAMVTKDCAPNGLYAGVPARRLRDLP